MAESMILPPWMTREYADPATTFLNAFKTGAAISQTQKEMAMQAHQNQVSAQLQRERIQQEALQSQAQLAASQAYHEMTNKMAQAQLEETKRQHMASMKMAGDQLIEQERTHRALEAIRQQTADTGAAKLNQPKYMDVGGVAYKIDPSTDTATALTQKPQKELTAKLDPLSPDKMEVGGPLPQVQEYLRQQEAAAKAEAEKKAQAQPPSQPGIVDRIGNTVGAWWRGNMFPSQAKPQVKPTGQRYTDKSGKVWIYTGTEYDPMSDKNPDNWQQE